jgi:HK97 family phage major capsid protein
MADLYDADEFTDFTLRVRSQWADAGLDALVAHRAEVATRTATLTGYAHRSGPQEQELQEAVAEQMELDSMIAAKHVAVRSERLELVRRAAADPANREGGAPMSTAPALVGRAHRETVRTRTPWQGLDEASRWRSEPMVGRAHDALEALDDEVAPAQGKERLAELLDDPAEQTFASQAAVSLSDPSYLRAFQSVLRDPQRGHLAWSAEERFAWNRAERVRSMSLGTASMGFALPLQLDPSFILVNAGSANPWRRLGTSKTTTSNTWNGVPTTGVNAAWLGEGAVASDASPTLLQLQVTPQKAAAWVFGSYESVGGGTFDGDVEFASQIGGLFADAKDRLEESTFTTGAGTGAIPSGFFTLQASGNDVTVAATAARAATDLYSTLEGVTPRFRTGQSARLAWLSSLTWLDKYRQIPAFSGALTSIVNDTGDMPRAAGISWYEESTMTTGTAAAGRAVAVGDWSQLYVVDRWPGQVLYEPLVTSQATATVGFPTGQSGWFYLWRSAIGITTTAAFKVLRFT